MTILAPIMLFGWIPLTIILFYTLKPHHAVLISVIGGWLFLPQIYYNLPGFPEYTKNTAIAIGLIIGGRLSGHRQEASSFQWNIYDLPIVIWCFFSPVATSLANELGLRDALSGSLQHIFVWGVPYLAGRIYFTSAKAFRDLCIWIIIGGLLYAALCLFEIRMSPKLSKIFYGIFPHSFSQHMRYGGYRPIVFMQHGLMVALWMAISSTVSFWFWRSGNIKHLNGIPLSFIVAILVVTTVLCKSANGWAILVLGFASYPLYRFFKTYRFFSSMILVVLAYITLRATSIISAEEIISVFAPFFDEERIASLDFRLFQENIICSKTLERPLFGWGGWGRGIPIDPDTGKKLLHTRDAMWLIIFNNYGFVGVMSLYTSLLIGPWILLSRKKLQNASEFFRSLVVVLSLIVVFFAVDSLFNGMISPLYITVSGALVTFYRMLCEKNNGNMGSERTDLFIFGDSVK